jgi:methionine-rich copper-binding protein CopC
MSAVRAVRALRVAVAIASILGLLSGLAEAHAVLKKASPAAGSILKQAPAEVRLQFNEKIEPRFSQIDVATSKGRRIATGPLTVDPQDRSQILVSLPALDPGRYKVKWRILSVDSHKVQGEFTFEIKP